MKSTSEQKQPIATWFPFVIKHVVLFCLSFLIALTAMARIKNGWTIEPLTWLALVWYLLLLIVCDFLILRGRGRISTLFILLTGVAIAIMFPFTAIQKANYRAQFRSSASNPPIKAKPIGLWNWWEVAPGEFVPRCLVWRIPIVGVDSIREFSCTYKEFARKNYPSWFLKEVDSFSYSAEPNVIEPPPDYRFPEVKLKPSFAYFNRKRNTSVGDIALAQRPRLDWLLKCVDFQNCVVLNVRDVDFSNESWEKLLTNKRLYKLDLYGTNIENLFTDSNVLYPKLEYLSLVKVPNITAEEVIGAIDRCPRLRQLSISAELLESRLFRKLFLEPRIFVIRLVGDQDELKLREQIEIHSQKPIHLSTFSKIDFTDKSVQSLFAHFRAVHLESCRLSAKDLMVLSKVNTARIEIRWCSMTKSEHQLLLTGVEAATQPANGQSTEPSSNADFAKIRYWINPQNLQIFVQD